MTYFVYLLITKYKNKVLSYVGYTNDVNKRIKLHNTSKGAKFTRGKYWRLIYKEKYKTKSEALIKEYDLKKNYKKRNEIKNNFLNKKD
jgi:putative endonuclease